MDSPRGWLSVDRFDPKLSGLQVVADNFWSGVKITKIRPVKRLPDSSVTFTPVNLIRAVIRTGHHGWLSVWIHPYVYTQP